MIKWKSLFLVFGVGLCITALEVASARLIAPFYGSTIYVWGGAIGTVLFALAIGYWLGGKVIDQRPRPEVVSWTLIVAGVTTVLIPWMYSFVISAVQRFETVVSVPIALSVTVTMGALFVVPIVALGMISPMMLRLTTTSIKDVGSWSGLLSGSATTGSIVGTFLSAYWTIPFFGTRMTIVVAGALLLVLSMIWHRQPISRTSVMFGVLVLTSALVTQTPFLPRRGLAAERQSAYQLVQVVEQRGTRYLLHDTGRGTQSVYTPGSSITNGPYDIFGYVPFMVQSEQRTRNVLLIGLGGANMPRLYEQLLGDTFQFSITAVEIDPVVVSMAKKYFALDELDVNVVVDDARHFLRTTDKKYDIIIVDAYTHETQIPPMLATQEFFQQTKERLKPGGVLAINALAFSESTYLPKFLSTIATVYPDVRETPFAEGALSHFIVAGESLGVSGVPTIMPTELQRYRETVTQRLRSVTPTGDIYTDDRTDLDIRVQPFSDQ
jgi:spermidine synthase